MGSAPSPRGAPWYDADHPVRADVARYCSWLSRWAWLRLHLRYAMPYVPQVTRPTSHATRKLTVKMVKKPAAYVHATKASFSWSHTGTVRSTTCKLDTRKATSCKRGRISYSKLAAGHHTFVLTVKGTSSRRTITRRWLIDLDAPLPPTSVLGGSTAWSTVPVTLTAAGGSDATSGLAGYQYQVSVNGGAWRSPVQRNPAAIGVEGSSIVQFRSVDKAGNTSSWVPSVPGSDNTVKIDTTPPAVPTLTGGSSAWQNVASVTVNASGGADGGSGFAHFGYRLSTDGGTTWSTELSGTGVTVPAEGSTLVHFRSYDVAGNASPWATATVMIDRANPTDPVVSGGSPAWQSVTSLHLTAAGSADTGSGIDTYQRETSIDGGLTWSAPANASSLTVTSQGETLVRFRAVDVSGRFSNWVTGIARIDHTAPVTPTLTGGSSAWQNVASVDVAATGTTDTGGSGFDHLSYRTSTDGGTTWGAETTGTHVTVSSQGATLVQFRGRDFAGNVTPWVSASVNIDRANPTDPVIANSSTAWQSVASINLVASSTDSPGSGIASYQRQVSTDGGATWGAMSTGASRSVTAEGETLVRFRAVDVSGKTSNWVVATARIDRTKPTDPNVSSAGAGWQNTSMLPLNASGSSDSGGSGLVGYQSEMSTNGAAFTSPVLGASVFVTSDGVTVVRFRSIDGAGNTSAWSQVTAMLDSSPPSNPTLTGWSPGWVNSASVVVKATGSADSWSGLGNYQLQTSTDGGALWSSLLSANQVTVTGEGSTVVRFRATDNVGNCVGLGVGDGQHRPHEAERAHVGDGRLDGVAERGVGDGDGVRLDRSGGRRGAVGLPDADVAGRGDVVGAGGGRLGHDLERGPDLRAGAVGGRRREHVGLGAGRADRGQHGQDRPVEPDGADGDRRLGELADERAGDGVGGGQHGCGQRDPQVRVRDVDERRGQLGRRHDRNDGVGLERGADAGAVPVGGQRVAGVAVGAGTGADRHGEAERSDGVGRQPDVEERGADRDLGVGVDGPGGWVGLCGLPVPGVDERRDDLDGGGGGQQLHGGERGADAGAVPVGRQRRQRVGLDAGRERGHEYGTDRPQRRRARRR